jgi:acyl-CoA thioester hydrolase
MTWMPPEPEPVAISGSGWIAAGVHRLPLRVYYEDTDAAGIVYHAAYLEFAERGRTEMLRCLGLDHGGLRDRFGLAFAVRRCVIDYLAPARLDDQLIVATRLLRRGGASLELEQRLCCAGRLLARIAVRLALVSPARGIARLPDELSAALAGLSAPGRTADPPG